VIVTSTRPSVRWGVRRRRRRRDGRRLVQPPGRVERLGAGPRPSRLVLGQLPFQLASLFDRRARTELLQLNSRRSSISPSASGSPPTSNGSRLAHSTASSIDLTWRISPRLF